MSAAWKTVRVFISSTFRDMHAERDHLVTVVFPELRERFEQLGLEFFDVDLRWGVPVKDANGETANSWEYCQQWIDRVEPFFVCILGQRYGWVPEPEQLRAREDRLRQEAERRSITDMEVRHAVLNTRLKRRSYFYLRAIEAPATAGEFVDPPPLLDKLEQLKDEVRSCGRPVRDYPCAWTGSGFTDVEEFGRLVLDDLWSGVLRDERYVSKEVWHQVLGRDPDTDPRYTDESQPVSENIAAKIVALARPAPVLPQDAEREQMDAFVASRLRWFQGRTGELQRLADFLDSTAADAPRIAVVAAVPGQGKSALLARLSTLIPQTSTFLIIHFVGATERSASAHALVERLLDALDRSGITWPDEQQEGQEPKRDFNSLCLRLAKRLGDYAGERRIVILLDALNQLSDGHDLRWLPARLGLGVRVVVSCVEDAAAKPGSREERVLRSLACRQPAPLRVPLGPLTESDVRTIVVEHLKEYCHELDREHLDTLCAITQARNPLYLLVMLNELRTLGGNDLNRIVPGLIASMPQDHPDTVSLFRWVLERLEVFGPKAVRWWCLYMAHGRVGMASQELADLLARKLGPDAGAAALRIERGLRRYLQRRGPQLDFFHGQLRQAVFEQYGPQAEPVTVHHEMADYFTACAKGTDPQKQWETDRVRGFAECVYHLVKAGQYDLAVGLLSNFVFLLHKTREGLLEGVFEDYDMVRREAPAEVARRLEIWDDFFREKAHILRRGSDEWPTHKILLQLAVEHADDSPLTIGAEQWLAENRCDWLWLRRVPRMPHAQKNPCLAVLEGHTDRVSGVRVLANGRLLSWSEYEKTLRLWDGQSGACLAVLKGHTDKIWSVQALSDGRLLSWSRDGTLRLWDGQSGACLAVMEGHTGRVSGVQVLANGRLLSWGASEWDKTLRLWDGQSRACLAVLEGHTDLVRGVQALSDGRLLSWSYDKTLRLWNGQSGACLAVLKGHRGWVVGVQTLSDGRLLSWSGDGTLRFWNGQSGACLAVLEGHTDLVRGVQALSDGRLLSWSEDKTLRLWDVQSGACLAVLKGHTDKVCGVQALSDGRLLSWSEDKTLRLWEVQSGACLAVLKGHTDKVCGVQALSDGRLLSWSEDKTLRLWEVQKRRLGDNLFGKVKHLFRTWYRRGQSGACLAVMEGHTGRVSGVQVLANGRMLSWSEQENTLRLWDVQSGACLAVMEGHTDHIRGVQALPGGRLLSWSEDKTLRLWEVQSGACPVVLEGHTDKIWSVQALSDGRLLSRSKDKTLRLWDVQSGACLAVMEGHTSDVDGVQALSDGRLLSWSEMDKTLRLWDGQSGACLAVLKGHTDRVWGVQALSDGRLLSWSEDKTLRLWEVQKRRLGDNLFGKIKHLFRTWYRRGQSGACLAVLEGHTGGVSGVLVLANGRLLSLSKDKTLRLWDVQSGACLAVLKGHTDRVWGVQALSDGRLLSWSEDKTLRLWDGQSGACLAVLEGHTSDVEGVQALSDGRLLSWSGDTTLRLWDGQSGACLAVLGGHTKDILGVQVLADGRLLSWSRDGTLRLWDGQSGACLAMLEGHTGEVEGVQALSDGRLLSWSRDRTLRLWDGQSGACLAVLKGHTKDILGVQALSDGRLLSWSRDTTLRLWDGQSGACLAVLKGYTDRVWGVQALSDGRLLLWSERDETLRLWDGQSGACLAVLKGHTRGVLGVQALSDGRLLSRSKDKTLRLWDGQSGACLAVMEGHTRPIRGLEALSDGRLLSWSGDGTLRFWNGQSGACLALMEGHTGGVLGVQVLADGRLLSGSYDRTLRLWDGQSGACLAVLEGHTGEVEGVQALSDGRLLSWSRDTTLRLWDGQSGACLAVMEGHTCPVTGVRALSDGRLLSWSERDNTLRFWDGQSGACLAVLKGHTRGVLGVQALSDGRLLSWSSDRTLRLWDGQSGACLAVMEGHTRPIRGLEALSDGRLLSWSGDGTLRFWNGQSGACLEVVPKEQVARRQPGWLHLVAKMENPASVSNDFFVGVLSRSAELRHKILTPILAVWNADSDTSNAHLLQDGTAVGGQANGQVCILKLHHGQRRISLAEAETLLPQLYPRELSVR